MWQKVWQCRPNYTRFDTVQHMNATDGQINTAMLYVLTTDKNNAYPHRFATQLTPNMHSVSYVRGPWPTNTTNWKLDRFKPVAFSTSRLWLKTHQHTSAGDKFTGLNSSQFLKWVMHLRFYPCTHLSITLHSVWHQSVRPINALILITILLLSHWRKPRALRDDAAHLPVCLFVCLSLASTKGRAGKYHYIFENIKM